MELINEIESLIAMHQEGPYWDFKREWYGDNKDGDMLIDIICMANNLVDRKSKHLLWEALKLEKDQSEFKMRDAFAQELLEHKWFIKAGYGGKKCLFGLVPLDDFQLMKAKLKDFIEKQEEKAELKRNTDIRRGEKSTMAYSREKIDMDALVKRLSAGHDRVRYDEGAEKLNLLMVSNRIPAGAKLY